MKTNILIVDDDIDMIELLTETLDDEFIVVSAADGNDALEKATNLQPEIILLDIGLPNISGYEVCESLKKQLPDTRIVFVSGSNTPEARQTAYDAGGDDFIAKPFRIAEVLRKIQLLNKSLCYSKQLKEEVHSVQSTAKNAISSMGEMGGVMSFSRSAAQSKNTESLLKDLVNCLSHSFNLDAAAQLTGYGIQKTLNTTGRSSPLEAEMLACITSESERIFQVGRRLVFNYPTVIVQVKLADQADNDLLGRIRDNVAIIVEVAETAFERIINTRIIERQAELSLKAMDVSKTIIATLDANFREQSGSSLRIFDDLSDRIDEELMFLDLTEEQESKVKSIVKNASSQAADIYASGKAMDEQFEKLLIALKPVDVNTVLELESIESSSEDELENASDQVDDNTILF